MDLCYFQLQLSDYLYSGKAKNLLSYFQQLFFFKIMKWETEGEKFWCHTLGRYLKTLELGESGRKKKHDIFNKLAWAMAFEI